MDIYSYLSIFSARGEILALVVLAQLLCTVFAIRLVQEAGKQKLFFIAMVSLLVVTLIAIGTIPVNSFMDG